MRWIGIRSRRGFVVSSGSRQRARPPRRAACNRLPAPDGMSASALQAMLARLVGVGNALDIRVLGNLEVRRGTETVAIGGPKPRHDAGDAGRGSRRRGVPPTGSARSSGATTQPADPGAVLQSNISRLRKAARARRSDRRPAARLRARDRRPTASTPGGSRRRAERHAPCVHGPGSGRWPLRTGAGECWSDRRTPSSPIASGRGPRWRGSRRCAPSPARSASRYDWTSVRTARSWPNSRRWCRSTPFASGRWLLLATALSPQRPLRGGAASHRRLSRPSFATSWGWTRRRPSVRWRARSSTPIPALLGATAAARRAAARGSARPRRRRCVGRSADLAGIVSRCWTSIASSRSSVPVASARHAWRCGWPPTCGRTAAARCTWWSWRRCTIRCPPWHRWPRGRRAAAPAPAVEETLVEYLRGRRALLVLDNCEHLRAAVATARRPTARRLPRCHACWRRAARCSVSPASMCGGSSRSRCAAAATSVDDWRSVPAVRLFVERGRRRRTPASCSDPTTSDAVAEIVRRVDGLPLAIELAAARSACDQPGGARRAARAAVRPARSRPAHAGRAPPHGARTRRRGPSICSTRTSRRCSPGCRCSPVGSGSTRSSDLRRRHARRTGAARHARRTRRQVDGAADDAHLGRYRVLEPLREFGRAAARRRGASRGERAPRALVPRPRRALAAEALAGPDEAAAAARLDRDFDNLRGCVLVARRARRRRARRRLVAALREYSFRSMRAEVIAWADDVIAMPGSRARRAPLVLAVAAYGRFVRGDLDSSIDYGELADRGVGPARRGVVRARRADARQLAVLPRRGRGGAEWIDRMLDDARAWLGGPAGPRALHAIGGVHQRRRRATRRRVRRGGARRGPPVRFADGARPGARTRSGWRSSPATRRRQRHCSPSAAEVAARAPATGGSRRSRSPRCCGSRPRQGAAADGARRLRRRDRHLVPRRRLGQPVALAAPRVRHPRAAPTTTAARPRCTARSRPRRRLRAAVRGLRRRAHRRNSSTTLRDRLGAADFAAAVRRGASMTDGEIIEFTQGRIAALAG